MIGRPSPGAAGATSAPPRHFPRWLGWILLSSLVLKLLIVVVVRDLECHGDQCAFVHAAQSLRSGEGFRYGTGDWDEGHTPPLYVLFVAGCLAIGGGSLTAVRVAQALLTTGTAAIVFLLASRIAPGRGARIATALVAFFPEFLAYFHWVFSESLFVLELAALALAAVRLDERRRFRDAALLGAILGAACLTRSMMLYFALPLAGWTFLRLRDVPLRAARLSALVVAVQLVVISPWTAYNYARFDRLLLLSTNAGNVVYRNLNTTPPENYDRESRFLPRVLPDAPPRARCREDNPVDRYRCELRNAREWVLTHPGATIRQAFGKLRALWNPGSFLIKYAASGAYGPPERGALVTMAAASAATLIAAALLGTLGFAGGATGALRSLTAVVFLYWHAIYGLAFGMSRYRMPLLLFVLLWAAVALARPREMLREGFRRRANVFLVPWLVFLVWSWWMYGPLLLRFR